MADSSSRFPSPDALELLRQTLRSGVGPAVLEGRLQVALRKICTEAREQGLRPEQLLVRLKAAWRSLPETHERPGGRQSELMQHAVTICIREYYESGNVKPEGGSSDTPV